MKTLKTVSGVVVTGLLALMLVGAVNNGDPFWSLGRGGIEHDYTNAIVGGTPTSTASFDSYGIGPLRRYSDGGISSSNAHFRIGSVLSPDGGFNVLQVKYADDQTSESTILTLSQSGVFNPSAGGGGVAGAGSRDQVAIWTDGGFIGGRPGLTVSDAGDLTAKSYLATIATDGGQAIAMQPGAIFSYDNLGLAGTWCKENPAKGNIFCYINSTDDGLVIDSPDGLSGDTFRLKHNGDDIFIVDRYGDAISASDIKSSGGHIYGSNTSPVAQCAGGDGGCTLSLPEQYLRTTVALDVSGNGTYPFNGDNGTPHKFSSVPQCFCQDAENTAALVTRCNATVSLLTVTGTSSHHIAAFCTGPY